MPAKKKTAKKSAAPKAPAPKPKAAPKKPPRRKAFPIVGLGASAGGLEALKAFFSNVTENSGLAYIVVVHMTPKQPSMMPQLLQNVTKIPVLPATDGQVIAPDHAYVLPPDKVIAIFQGRIQLLDIIESGFTLPIDQFLKSLAQDQGSNAAAVILSGTGTDGTSGVSAIKANDGLVLVQTDQSAHYDGMPRSAAATGLADVILPPEEMPRKLIQYFTNPATSFGQKSTAIASEKSDQRQWLNKIFAILRTQVGHDFSPYKINTILRRIGRRMGLNRIDSHETYVRFLRKNPSEVDALFRELLIGVTNFFRDSASFDALATGILPGLFDKMAADATFRAWIPGCSTGEEVYSLAILLHECLEKFPKTIHLQLFGTDIDNAAIEKAREGLYPASIAADVSKVRLKRYFTKEGDFYRIRKEIRDCTVFSTQNMIKDPPFSRLHLLCCRNLLIYLDTEAQKKLLPLFHYTLNPNGILVLGASETIGGFTNLFKTLDSKWKIFARQEVPAAMRQMVDFPSGLPRQEPTFETIQAVRSIPPSDISALTQQAILNHFAPTAILTDANGRILHVQGRTGKYLETPSGPPTDNLMDLAREGLRIELSVAMRAARASGSQVTRKRLSIRNDGDAQTIDLHVCPLTTPQELAGRFLVVFENVDVKPPDGDSPEGAPVGARDESSRIAELERELQITRESHQTTIEELESSNEELKSTNEEMQSANEELQSTNEEMESSKEELQSLNEELQTVNAELQSKVEELSAAHDDMRNLLNSTEIATIFVDNDKRIRRFTTKATAIVNLIHTDIGRPLQHVVSNLQYEAMIQDLGEVLATLAPKAVEVQTADGKWFAMRIMPYRTMDNRIDGAVMTFSSIDDQIRALRVMEEAALESAQAEEMVRATFDMMLNPFAVLDAAGNVVIANSKFCTIFDTTHEDLNGKNPFRLESRVSDPKSLRSALKTAMSRAADFNIQSCEVKTSTGKQRVAIQGRIVKINGDLPYRILLHFLIAR